jgi:hypothetical protein
MTDSWQCDICGRHFTSTENRIQLERKIRNGSNKYEYISYLEMCADCELYVKKRLKSVGETMTRAYST